MRKTIQEILFQPKAWEKTIQTLSGQKAEIITYLKNYQTAEIILTGCGSSYYLSQTAAALYTKYTGEKARGVPASEIMLFPETIFARDRKYLLVPISRSGITHETLSAARYVKDVVKGGTLLISCTEGSEMAKYADLSIVSPSAAEETKYMTKSFTSMLLAFQLLIAYKTGNKSFEEELKRLPEHGERLINKYQTFMEQLAGTQDYNLYIYLGHGPLYGIAAESMLKIKEMACTPAEAYHGMEFMHGPKYAVNDKTLIIYLLSASAQKQEIDLLKRIKELGGNIKIICEESTPEIIEIADDVFELKCGLSENATPILITLLTQLYGYYRALAIGKDLE
ncbi:MAG: SIS domain-containing protein [Lentimicrobiaceae bacterium]|jgi:glucosamine--fructose-6-phosphate aminotransferase (isomerizing)